MNIYVGNLSHDATEAELKTAFEEFGEVSSANIIKDKFTQQSRGFGFVEMANSEEAQTAIEQMNGKDFMGRSLNVNEARARQDRPPRRNNGGGAPRGGGGGGGGRGRW